MILNLNSTRILTLSLLILTAQTFFEEDPETLKAKGMPVSDHTELSVKNLILGNQDVTSILEEKLTESAKFNEVELKSIIADEDEYFTVLGERNGFNVSLKIKQLPNDENFQEPLQAFAWENRTEINNLNPCQRGPATLQLLESIGVDMDYFNGVIAYDLIYIEETAMSDEIFLCVSMKFHSLTLNDYVETNLEENDRLVDFTKAMVRLTDTLAVLESINVITGDLRDDNILMFKQGSEVNPVIDFLDLAKFVTFEVPNEDSTIRYQEIYREKLMSSLRIRDEEVDANVKMMMEDEILEAEQTFMQTQSMYQGNMGQSSMNQFNNMQSAAMYDDIDEIQIDEEQPRKSVFDEENVFNDLTGMRMSVIDKIMTNDATYWNYDQYRYTAKEDNYAFGIMLLQLTNSLNLFDDSTVKSILVEKFNDFIGGLTDLNPQTRMNFVDVSATLKDTFWNNEAVNSAIEQEANAVLQTLQSTSDPDVEKWQTALAIGEFKFTEENSISILQEFLSANDSLVSMEKAIKEAKFGEWGEYFSKVEEDFSLNFDDPPEDFE